MGAESRCAKGASQRCSATVAIALSTQGHRASGQVQVIFVASSV